MITQFTKIEVIQNRSKGMDMTGIGQLIGTLGFPVVCCLILFFGCKYMLDNQQKNTDKMFEMYDKSNTENREAIRACTEAVNKLCDSLEDIKKGV